MKKIRNLTFNYVGIIQNILNALGDKKTKKLLQRVWYGLMMVGWIFYINLT